jgi:Immunity protein 22
MPRTLTHSDCRVAGVVSLWLGRISSESEMDDYLSAQFCHDYGFRIDPNDGPESDASPERKPIDVLLHGFSFSWTFAQEAIAGARGRGWSEANGAVVFYNFRYMPEFDRSSSESPMQFIGTFRMRERGVTNGVGES